MDGNGQFNMVFAGLKRFIGLSQARDRLDPLYRSITVIARQPHWYQECAVPDSVEGRFEMVALILSLLLLRLESEDGNGATQASLLTEVFIADMDGQMREDGIGDAGVGMRMGKMMSALGGRISVYRTGIEQGDLQAALTRNLYRGAPPEENVLDGVEGEVMQLIRDLAALPLDMILVGRLSA